MPVKLSPHCSRVRRSVRSSAMRNRTILLLLLVLSSLMARGQQPVPQPSSIPSTSTIAYYAQPGNRTALREYMTQSGLRQLETWKSEGLFSDFRVLFSSYLDTDLPNRGFLRYREFLRSTGRGMIFHDCQLSNDEAIWLEPLVRGTHSGAPIRK